MTQREASFVKCVHDGQLSQPITFSGGFFFFQATDKVARTGFLMLLTMF